MLLPSRTASLALAAGAALALVALARRRRRACGPPVVFGADEPIVMMDAVHGMACRLVHGVPYVTFITQAGLDALRAHFAPRPTDIFVATSPKCGTTWAQQLVLLLVRGGAASAVRDPMIEAPWLERGVCLGELTLDGEPAGARHRRRRRRPCSRPAAPWALARCALGDAKVVYVARNAKDACVSAFFHNRAIPAHEYDGPWDNFVSSTKTVVSSTGGGLTTCAAGGRRCARPRRSAGSRTRSSTRGHARPCGASRGSSRSTAPRPTRSSTRRSPARVQR